MANPESTTLDAMDMFLSIEGLVLNEQQMGHVLQRS